ncbi:MAG: hypothetical protein K2M47_03615 [Clostridiales bacterium]|nr:hypothetical protein [Clostridiales bacterium]
MKVLVIEIEKDALIKCLQKFELTNQITFLDELAVPNDDAKYKTAYKNIDNPYYIEENFIDLDKLISIYESISYIKMRLDIHEFSGFYELIFNIKKQREIGYPISDIEYVYKIGLQHSLPIEYHHVSELDGFIEGTDFYVITGQSNLGKMMLYQENDCTDFVFSIEYKRIKMFSKKKIADGTHWHPYTYIGAIEDMIAFITNDSEYFYKRGFSFINKI